MEPIKIEPGKKYYVLIKAHNGKLISSTAVYYPKHYKEGIIDDFHGELDYNEENDEYYWPEGWYESQYEPEISWQISDPIVKVALISSINSFDYTLK